MIGACIDLSEVVKPPAALYQSMDMKKGIDHNSIMAAEKTCSALLRLDPRGGIFRQQDVKSGLQTVLTENGKLSEVWGFAEQGNETPGTVLDVISYKLRVMLSHVRGAYDSCKQKKGHPLNSLFDIIDTKQVSGVKRRRRQARVGQQNPFINFRTENTGDEESSDTESWTDISLVAKHWNPAVRVGIALMSDGSELRADSYVAGPRGFVTCVWLHPAMELETEVPNSCLVDGQVQVVVRPPPPRRQPKKAGQHGHINAS